MNRKLILLYGIAVGIFVLAGSFFYWYGKHHAAPKAPLRPGEEYGVEYRQPGEIVVEDLGNTKRVTDTRQGYSVEVPSSWILEKPSTVDAILNFSSNGCGFSSGYLAGSNTLDTLLKQRDQDLRFVTVRLNEVEKNLTLGGHPAVRSRLDTLENGYVEGVDIQVEDQKVFTLSYGVTGQDQKRCSSEFEDVLRKLELK